MVAKASVSKTAAVGGVPLAASSGGSAAQVAAVLTAVVNEIEESGGQAEHQLKELAAYLASWLQKSKSKD